MTEYDYNDDKPEQLLTGYSSVRGAELKTIYRVLDEQGDVPVSALEERFGKPNATSTTRNTDHVDQCLKFLQAVDVIEVSPQKVVSMMNEEVYPEITAFEPRLLHHIRQQTGKQRHLTYLSEVAVAQNQSRVTEEELLEAVKEDDDHTFELTWREEKLRMWANLLDHLGGLSYLNRSDPNMILIAPNRRLLGDLLAWYNQNGDDPDRLVRALEWIDEEFHPVFADRAGTPTVSAGTADVLENMEGEGVLSLRAMSDTQTVVEVPRSNGAGSREVATFSIDSTPNRSSYWYPLDRSERRVNV